MKTLNTIFFASVLLFHCCLPVPAPAQVKPDLEEALSRLYGDAGSSADESDLWRLQQLYSSPLPVNRCSPGQLSESGLFTPYQIASIEDYRQRMGDIMSLAEFALLDGIGEYFAQSLAPFISFSGTDAAPSHKTSETSASFKVKDSATAWTLRTSLQTDALKAALAARTVYADASVFPPSSHAFYLGWNIGMVKVFAGDFNARFGQGLAMWSGLSFTGVSTPLSLYKRGCGLGGSSSLGGSSYRGFAARAILGRVEVSSFLNLQGELMPGANATWYFGSGQIGFTGYYGKGKGSVSADARFCIKGTDYFGEVAYEPVQKSLAGLLGAVFPVFDRGRIGFQARYYPRNFKGTYAGAVRTWTKTSDEGGLSLSYGSGDLSVSADGAFKPSAKRKQLKVTASDILRFGRVLALKLKAQYRTKNSGSGRNRTELRCDLCYGASPVKVNLRLHALHCDRTGLLGYLEAAYERTETFIVWLRGTVFSAQKWNDRIYCYERDAPGNFLVPAYYGKGCCASIYGRAKFRFKRQSLACYLRASYTGYFQKKKPSVPELRFSMSYSF